MGMIMDEKRGAKIHGEARRESFVLFSAFGEDAIELEWRYLDETIAMLYRLRSYHNRDKAGEKEHKP